MFKIIITDKNNEVSTLQGTLELYWIFGTYLVGNNVSQNS